MNKPSFSIALLHPKYWPTWLGFGILWVLVNILPLRAQHTLGNLLGRALGTAIKKRAKIAHKNLELCFPEKSAAQRADIYRQSMEAAGRGVFESGAAWFCSQNKLKKFYEIHGLEHIKTAQNQGIGVLFLGIHFTTIEIGAAFINMSSSIDGFYRPNANKAFDYIQRKGRERHNSTSQVIPRKNVRGIIKSLKSGRTINYTTDQDYGRKHSIFVPFFNISTATTPAPSQLIKLSGAKVIPYTTGWSKAKSKYVITIYPAMEELGKNTPETDAIIINQFIEEKIRENPGQYLWSHRRFKTRPDGQKDFYMVETERYRKKRDRQKVEKSHKS